MSTNFKLKNYDLIVLGAGSGGLAAAKRAASYGASVAIIEGDQIGGTCVVRGCVPKKLMAYGAKYGDALKHTGSYGFNIGSVKINSEVLLRNIQKEVMRLSDMHRNFLEKSGVEIIQGWGEFIDRNTIQVRSRENDHFTQIVNSELILISVGGRPVRPNIQGSSLAWMSNDMFLLKRFPNKIVIVGAGFIACEFACILNGYGVEVTQLVRGDHLLKGFDRELTSFLGASMTSKNINLRFNEYPVSIKGEPGCLHVETSADKSIDTNGVLFATGREPFLEGLKVDKAGIVIDENRIKVDKENRTNIPNIYAIGDVTNRFNLTPVAIEEGRVFSDRVFGNIKRIVNYNQVPVAVFSKPEIASVGLSEEQSVKLLGKDNVKIFRSEFRSLAYSLPKAENKCILKLIVDTSNDKILGCHMIGDDASEIIQMASISLMMGAKKSDFDLTMALHPTVAEEFVTMI